MLKTVAQLALWCSIMVFSAQATAQIQTTCIGDVNVTNCESRGRLGSSREPIDYSKALQDGQNLVPDYNDMEAKEEALREARDKRFAMKRAADLAAHVGSLIAAGDCPGAEKAALTAGDLDLARQARDYCATVPK